MWTASAPVWKDADMMDKTNTRALQTAKRREQLIKPETTIQVICALVFLLGWEAIVRILDVPKYLMPAPSGVLTALIGGLQDGTLLANSWVTLNEVLLGLLCGGCFGFVLGVLLAEFPMVNAAARPFLVASQVTPKTALAPLFIIWFGFGISSKVFIAALMSFFPVLVNTLAGISATDVDRLVMMRVYRSSRWQILRFVKLPGALPHIMSGLEVAAVLAVMGAIIGEFVGAKEGLGRLIIYAGEQLDLNLVFAAIIMLILMGGALQGLVSLARRKVLFWVGR
jgi:NitT/TauT family transport system permease protein